MYAAADHIKEFEGVLVSRKYRPGHDYIQLVFKVGDDLQLCLSQNVQMVRGLRLGETYYVQGQRHVIGQRQYVRNPAVTLVETEAAGSKRRLWFVGSAACLVFLLGVGGVFALFSDDPKPTKQPRRNAASESQQTLSAQTEEPQPESSTTTTPETTTAPAPSTTAPTAAPRQTRNTTAPSSTPTPPPPVQPSTPPSPPAAPPPPPAEETTPPAENPDPPSETPPEPPADPPSEDSTQ